VLVRPGDAVAVEDPVYHGLKNAFSRAGARLIGVRMADGGVDLEQLAGVLAAARPKLLILTPNFQNPTGATMNMEARLSVLALARRYQTAVVENDIYGELRYEGQALPTVKALDESGGAILLRSFSKIAFPGLRVGWIVAPRKIVAELTEARQWCDLHTDQLSQAILWRFAESGRLDAHLERVRAAGKERLAAALRACERHLPAGSQFTRPQGGMNLWVRLPRNLDAAELLSRAQREGVSYVPGRHFVVSETQPAAFRLSFGGLSPERIEAGVATLGRVFKEEMVNASAPRWESVSALV
jgi:2-aminoadipate transaminase